LAIPDILDRIINRIFIRIKKYLYENINKVGIDLVAEILVTLL